ncbi:signal peptide peptidase-like 4 isoform X1 [Helianthus annuus]|nr:signal peptide peptidase-like 4 isoform X1 [Helianthus annuus]
MFSTVYVQLYTPKRPSVDVAEVFLAYECWYHSMCILVVCLEAEAAIELDKLLKDASNEYMSTEVSYFSGVFEITNTSVIVFIVVSSCFLVWLYKNMSYVFIEVLVVLFAIGGGEGVALIITVIQIIQVPNLKLQIQ